LFIEFKKLRWRKVEYCHTMNIVDHASIGPRSVSKIEPPRISLIPFAARAPSVTLDSMIDITTSAKSFRQHSVVGTITLLQNCVIIWVGWGDAEEIHHQDDSTKTDLQSVTWTGKPPQGHCTVAMPRASSYKGAFSDGLRELPSSQIIGGGSTDAQVLASQMASRLSAKLSMAVFVSCQLTSEVGTQSDESSRHPPLAAAAAEKEIFKALHSELAKQKRK